MSRPVVAVPRRPDGGQRDRLWAYCLRWWQTEHPSWLITEGSTPADTERVGPFNRGAALNVAVGNVSRADPVLGAGWTSVIVADADVVCPPDQLRSAVQRAEETGRVTLPYTDYAALTPAMTDDVLGGFTGDWSRGVRLRMAAKPHDNATGHVSSLVVVPRQLWRELEGFDERFVGWGHDDVAFIAAARVLGGGVERVPGTVWHLWHEDSPERQKRSPLLRASAALARRYAGAVTPEQMSAIVRERREPDGVLLIVTTNGRRDCLARSARSVMDACEGLPIVRQLICDDSGDADFHAWLRLHFSLWDLQLAPRAQGYSAAMRTAWQAALESGQRLVLWAEDDFLYRQRVPLDALAGVLDLHPELAQVSLLRQPWYPQERERGYVIAPDDTTRHSGWLEHDRYWTCNPSLIPRSTFARYDWPSGAGSEAALGQRMRDDGRTFGIWGDGEEWVEHVGEERVGSGY